MNSKERFLNACARKPVDRPPVWLMRQAGRYLPEYRLLRARHSFIEICKDPKLACEASLQPWQRFKMDAVIVFSDILFVPEAMGQKLTFNEGEGPKLTPLIDSPAGIGLLKKPDVTTFFQFVYDALDLLKTNLKQDVPIIGFAGAPWTLATYMTGDNCYDWIKSDPAALKKLLGEIADVVGEYARLQQLHGADAIQLFDTWGGELSREDFKEFALPYIKQVIRIAKKRSPFIIYSRKCSHILEELAESGADVVSIDPETPVELAIKKIGGRCAIQGNIDPKTMLTTPGFVKEETSRILSKTKGFNGFIANLGHGVLPTTPLECVEAFVETVCKG